MPLVVHHVSSADLNDRIDFRIAVEGFSDATMTLENVMSMKHLLKTGLNPLDVEWCSFPFSVDDKETLINSFTDLKFDKPELRE